MVNKKVMKNLENWATEMAEAVYFVKLICEKAKKKDREKLEVLLNMLSPNWEEAREPYSIDIKIGNRKFPYVKEKWECEWTKTIMKETNNVYFQSSNGTVTDIYPKNHICPYCHKSIKIVKETENEK